MMAAGSRLHIPPPARPEVRAPPRAHYIIYRVEHMHVEFTSLCLLVQANELHPDEVRGGIGVQAAVMSLANKHGEKDAFRDRGLAVQLDLFQVW